MKTKLAIATLVALLFFSCEPEGQQTTSQNDDKRKVVVPKFNGDSAYAFVQKQVDFGPRVPNTPAHDACAEYLAETLRGYGGEVIVQEAVVIAWDGTPLNMKNIIGQWAPEKKKRLLLYAHWDTRPYADKDTVRMNEPIDGANDGGSGVGVLLEVARLMSENPPDVGIDIIFFDTEDYGPPEWEEEDNRAYTDWCLGSQYWSANKHKPGYRAKFGILLDMVGGKDAIFHKEGTSMAFAPNVVNHIWSVAKDLGYADRFRDKITPQTIDDNYFVTYVAGIPSANIVEYHVDVLTMGYGKFHHTHLDNMSIIDVATLEMVGHVVMETIYGE